jgi:hypothetical protein
LILKFWMHLSRDAQKERLRKLEKNPLLHWRISKRDWRHWEMYDQFIAAAERTPFLSWGCVCARQVVCAPRTHPPPPTPPRFPALFPNEQRLERFLVLVVPGRPPAAGYWRRTCRSARRRRRHGRTPAIRPERECGRRRRRRRPRNSGPGHAGHALRDGHRSPGRRSLLDGLARKPGTAPSHDHDGTPASDPRGPGTLPGPACPTGPGDRDRPPRVGAGGRGRRRR